MANLEGESSPQPGPQYSQESRRPQVDLEGRVEKLEELVGELIADKTHTHRTMGGH